MKKETLDKAKRLEECIRLSSIAWWEKEIDFENLKIMCNWDYKLVADLKSLIQKHHNMWIKELDEL